MPFLLLFFVQLAHHQLWLDELNAWGIAAASPTVGRLFHYIHYEAHPALWYLLLWPFTRFTLAPVAMKWVEAAIGTMIYLFLAFKSPFSRTEKILLYLSYFISFEYTVLSRMYGLLLLLTLIYAHRRATRPAQVVTNALLLAVMANTDMMGILLSAALACEYLINRLAVEPIERSVQKSRIAFAGLLYAAAVACAVLMLKPAKDISRFNPDKIFSYALSIPHLLLAAVSYVVLPWFPISPGFPHHFWEHAVRVLGVYGALLPCILLMFYFLFRRDRSSRLVLGFTILNAVLFAHLIYLGFMRHYGLVFLGFLVALWLQRARRPSVPALSYVFLGLSALGGLQAAYAQWNHPFSNNGNAAAYIRAHHLENIPLVGAYEVSVAGVAEELEKPAYFLDCSCSDTFLQYDNRRDGFRWDEVPQRLDRAFTDLRRDRLLFVTSQPLSPAELQQLRARSISLSLLASYHGAEAPYDPAVLYLADRAASH